MYDNVHYIGHLIFRQYVYSKIRGYLMNVKRSQLRNIPFPIGSILEIIIVLC